MANSQTAISQLGGGIIEISAVATLIGASTASSMTLGMKSAACLPWASMSSFGLLHVARASLSASIPDLLRESLGLQDPNAEAALGLCETLNKATKAKSRVDFGDIIAVSVSLNAQAMITDTRHEPLVQDATVIEVRPERRMAHIRSILQKRHQKKLASAQTATLCVYRLDRTSALALDTVAESDTDKGIPIHEFIPDIVGHPKEWKDWVTLLAAFCKAAEIVVLWAYDANALCWFTGLPCAFGFLSGLVLMVCSRSRDHQTDERTDIVTGYLPSPIKSGRHGKIVIGLPMNVRRSRLWSIVWPLYSITALVGLVGTFLVLGRNSSKVVYLWTGFQALWLLCRTLVFYLVESASGSRQTLMISRRWETSPMWLKARSMRLLMALSQQQATLHPRGVSQYQHDLTDIATLISHFKSSGWILQEHLNLKSGQEASPIRILDVVGDNVLRSIGWFSSVSLSNSEVYDTSLVFVSIAGQCIAVPAVRATTCRCSRSEQKIWPRGDSHGESCGTISWVFWIPATLDKDPTVTWLYVSGLRTKGLLPCECLSTEELDRRVAKREWVVSFLTIGDLDAVVQASRQASKVLMGLVLGLVPPSGMMKVQED